ncbi:hypothetical protein BGX34_000238 [Mortierella sp. NVP85]|nr:hypothetical protein BGX34_000238 [Mortierella sp. NVP85]
MIAAANGVPPNSSDQDLHPRIEAAYTDLGKLQDHLGQSEKAQASHKIALKYKNSSEIVQENNQSAQPSYLGKGADSTRDTSRIPAETTPDAITFNPPEADDVESTLLRLKKLRLKERHSSVYIPVHAKASLLAHDETRFPLMEKIKGWLANYQKVFLLLGDSGSGKSTFNRELERELWESYEPKGLIPLHINLALIDKPESDMIAKQLRMANFTESQIQELKIHRKFILICDGYDENQQAQNLYTSNRLGEPGGWQAKMVISCRSDYIGFDYRKRFQPGDRNHPGELALFQEAVITPFSTAQIQDYIDQFVSVHQPLWKAEQYKKALDLVPSLRELMRTPSLIAFSLEVLPQIVEPGQGLSASCITRTAFYDHFVKHWLEQGKKQLEEKDTNPEARATLERLCNQGFTQKGFDFIKRLSVAIYTKQGGRPIVHYWTNDEGSWKAAFFGREDDKQLLRQACPLIQSGNNYRFVHRSILEYGLALAVFDSNSDLRDMEKDEAASAIIAPCLSSPLAWKSFVNEPSFLQFLEERVHHEPAFKQLLLNFIELSKADKQWSTAAANAITILVRAGVQFIGADLQRVRIPGADLSYGVFESAQFQGADLENANLRGVWMPQANLNEAQMKGAQFGELLYLTQENNVKSMVYSPDGRTFVVGLENGRINVYLTSSWEKLWTSTDHSNDISSLSYSPRSDQFASSSCDEGIRIWDVITGSCRHVLTGHSWAVTHVVYSPRGDQVASSGADNTVRLWDTTTGRCSRTLKGHTECVFRVEYSPRGNQLASCSADLTIRLWDAESGVCSSTISGHSGWIRSVVYSPQGNRIVSASDDNTVRLWNVETGVCLHILRGHDYEVNLAIYSPKGDRVVSASKDTVRLWDVEDGTLQHTIIANHSDTANNVAFSPRGNRVASCSQGNTITLWDPESGASRQILLGHTGSTSGVAFSPKGSLIASSGYDKTVRLWDVKSGPSRHVSVGHHGEVLGVKPSPKGDQFASNGSDGTIRLWDMESRTCRHTLTGHDGPIMGIAYAPGGGQIASTSTDMTVRLWDVATGECRKSLTGHTNWIPCIAYSPQGRQIASCDIDSKVLLWDVESGVCSYILHGHQKPVNVVIYSPRENQVASVSDDATIRLWDTKTGVCLHTLAEHSKGVLTAAYSPRGNQIVSGSKDKTIRLWDVQTGKCLHTLEGHDGLVNMVAFSPRGDQIASASKDMTVRLWDAQTGVCSRILSGHFHIVYVVAYSPQGDLVASASKDKTVRLWDTLSGQCRGEIQVNCIANGVTWAPSRDGLYLIVGFEDGSVRMWQVMKDGDRYDVRLQWRATKAELTVTGVSIQDVQGLSPSNRKLLVQRGAMGRPVQHLRDARRVVSMAGIFLQSKPSSNKMADDPSPAASKPSVDESEQAIKQARESERLKVRRYSA